jgi:ABC-type iron transport system FetAB ATPase subunit
VGLVVRGLTSPLLAPVELEIGDGEAVVVRGASGSGKTLLLRALADLDPSEGEVTVDGRARSSMTGPAWRRLVRYAAAEPAWWGDGVGEHFRDPGTVEPTRLGLGTDCMGWSVARLSTGEKQRLGLLRALEDRPRAMLLDEPTAALDSEAEAAVEALLRERLAAGACLLLVTHGEAQAKRLARRQMVMEHGRLRAVT